MRTRTKQSVAVLVAATLMGVWLGTSAPSVSPVAPAVAATPAPQAEGRRR